MLPVQIDLGVFVLGQRMLRVKADGVACVEHGYGAHQHVACCAYKHSAFGLRQAGQRICAENARQSKAVAAAYARHLLEIRCLRCTHKLSWQRRLADKAELWLGLRLSCVSNRLAADDRCSLRFCRCRVWRLRLLALFLCLRRCGLWHLCLLVFGFCLLLGSVWRLSLLALLFSVGRSVRRALLRLYCDRRQLVRLRLDRRCRNDVRALLISLPQLVRRSGISRACGG